MKRAKDPLILSTQHLIKVLSANQSFFFEVDTVLVYEDHIPHTAIILLNGTIQILKKKKLIKTHHQKGVLLGWISLMEGEVSQFTIKVLAKSELVLVGKAEVKRLHLNELKEVAHAH